MLRLNIALVALVSYCLAAPIDSESDHCKDELKTAGATEFFARNVAHRLHSISLEDIQKYFSAGVTEENNIPTVNKDLGSEERVLNHAPATGYDDSFTTDALKYIDLILRNMDKDHYSITNFSVLEKIAHVLHMNELWNRASTHYQTLLLQPSSPDTCLCVSNTDTNGITQELNLLALKIKYPGITSGEYEKLKELSELGYDIDYSYGKLDAPEPPAPKGYDISYDYGKRAAPNPPPGYDIDYSYGKTEDPSAGFQKKVLEFDFSGEEKEVVERVSKELVDGDHGMAVHLDSEAGWAYWKEKMSAMKEVGNYEFALFMYCKLNQ